MDARHASVERAAAIMWSRYSEPLSLGQMAEAAILSKFHFSRVFRNITGTSPGRFLAAIRLYKAKQLLLGTSMSVTDISYRVGYNSLGTFASRFARSIGAPPARYRALSYSGFPRVSQPAPPRYSPSSGAIHGRVTLPDTTVPIRVYVAAFRGPLVEGTPIACTVLDSSRDFRLDAVANGPCFVRACAVATHDSRPCPGLRSPLFVFASPAVTVRTGHEIEVGIGMHPAGPTDPPVLLALPELDSQYLPALPALPVAG